MHFGEPSLRRKRIWTQLTGHFCPTREQHSTAAPHPLRCSARLSKALGGTFGDSADAGSHTMAAHGVAAGAAAGDTAASAYASMPQGIINHLVVYGRMLPWSTDHGTFWI